MLHDSDLQSDPNVTQLRLNYYCTNISQKNEGGWENWDVSPKTPFEHVCMIEDIMNKYCALGNNLLLSF
jgi:hypothetical protein